MNRMQIESKINESIKPFLENHDCIIRGNDTFKKIVSDSIDRIYIVIDIEQKFNVFFTDEFLSKPIKIKDIYDYVEENNF